jgi:DNA-binding transcriptional MerR regulator
VENQMKMKQVADRLGKHDNTIRKYAQQFAEFLSPAPAKGEHRIFTDEDLRVIAFISKLSDSGMKLAEVYDALKRKMDEGTPFPPVLPLLLPTDKQGLITVQEMDARLAYKDAELKELTGRLEELRKQLADLIERNRQEREAYVEQIARLSEEIGRLKAELIAK